MIFIVVLIVSFLPARFAFGSQAPVYRATGGKNVVVLKTPYGTRTLVGDEAFAKLKSYRFTIPLDDLKPAPIQLVLNTVPSVVPATPAAAVSAGSAEAPAQNAGNTGNAGKTEEKITEETTDGSTDESNEGTIDRQVERALARANRLYNSRKFSESEEVVDEALELKPGSVRAWMMKGSLLKLKGKSKEASEAWEKARSLERSPREVPAMMEGGSV
jgi:hypothetical protein